MPYLLHLEKQQTLKFSSDANCRLRLMGEESQMSETGDEMAVLLHCSFVLAERGIV